MNDCIQRFYFPASGIRGALVKLSNSYIEALNGHDYQPAIRSLLGECLAAATLLNTNIKQINRLTLQARGEGVVRLLMAESQLINLSSSHDATGDSAPVHQTVRALARGAISPADAGIPDNSELANLLGNAQLSITMEPESGERYQGIVSLDDSTLAGCLENYFLQSEQLETFVCLHSNKTCAAGLMLQKTPETGGQSDPDKTSDWGELSMLARSMTADELTSLPAEQSLQRLFHQHGYAALPPQAIEFQCSCSMQRTSRAISQVDPRDIEQILEEAGAVVLDCEFCGARYRFDRTAIEQLDMAKSGTRH